MADQAAGGVSAGPARPRAGLPELQGATRGLKRPRLVRNLVAYGALLPALVIALAAYVFTVCWTIWLSFTDSRMIPLNTYAGLRQYRRLFGTERWGVSVENVVVFGVLFIAGCLVFGFLLAVALDQRVKLENTLRTIFLYPLAMSFIVTGLVWQWITNPTLGVQRAVQNLGFDWFRFDWIVQSDRALYVIVLAGVWQSTGLVMAIMLAGLRGVDQELWKAARIDGIPTWRVYLHIVLPILRPTLITASVLLGIAVVRVYELVIATTGGGPGIATEVPAKFVMDYLFGRANVGLATAASTIMFLAVVVVITPWLYAEYFRPRRENA